MKSCVLLWLSVVVMFSSLASVTEERVDELIRSYAYRADQMDVKIRDNKLELLNLGYDKFPALFSLYHKNKQDTRYVNEIIYQFLVTDGDDISSWGNGSALDITRETLRMSDKSNFCLPGIIYIAKKGTPSDLPLLKSIRLRATDKRLLEWTERMLNVLEIRIAGTNIIAGVVNEIDIRNICQVVPAFIPSVTNTGPQAELVFQRIKQELAKVNGDVKKLPPELLTLTISPPQPVIERFKENRLLIGAGVLFLAGIGVLVFWRIKKR